MQTVIGLFESAFEAQQAAQQLRGAGFSNENIDVSVRNESTSNNYSRDSYFSGENDAGVMGDNVAPGSSAISARDYRTGDMTDNTEGATGGTGMTLGNYERTDNYETTDDNERSGEGRHSVENESFGDKISHFFKNLFGNDDDQAGRYSHVANRTGNLITVHAQTEEEAERARDILDENGAMDVDDRAAQYGYVDEKKNFSSDVKEDVEVSNREINTGERLRSRIIGRPIEEQLRLREKE